MKKIYSVILGILVGLFVCSCGENGTEKVVSEKSVMEETNWHEQYDLSMRYLEEGNYEEAIVAFAKVIEIDAKQVMAYIGRGDAYVLSGETEENLAAAQSDYETAIRLDENCVEGYLGLADVYIRQEEYEKVLEVLHQGYEKTNAEEIQDKIGEIESGKITDSQNNERKISKYDDLGNLCWYFIYSYDEQKRQSGITAYDREGKETGHIEFLYDDLGNQIQAYTYFDAGDEVELARDTREYDENGNLISTVINGLNDDSLWGAFKMEYDDTGKLKKQIEYGSTYDIIAVTLFEYAGDIEKRMVYDSTEQHLRDYEIDQYNEAGKIIQHSLYSAEDVLESYEIFEYDEEERLLRVTFYDGNDNIMSVETYD